MIFKNSEKIVKNFQKMQNLVSKHILIWRTRWKVPINYLNFENENMREWCTLGAQMRGCILTLLLYYIYIYYIIYTYTYIILYYIIFSYGRKKSGMKNVDPDYL